MLSYQYLKYHHGRFRAKLKASLTRKLYIPCFEIPITTFCTLKCKHCSNLIQYYEKPYHIETSILVDDVKRVLASVDGIGCIRILGGEPLLSPAIYQILELLITSIKINSIVIVTNGTLLFDNETLKLIKETHKIKVSISNYELSSIRLKDLENQLKTNHINYEIRNVEWREKSTILKNDLSHEELKRFFETCPNKFFSLLNGKIHICPKSAHAVDLDLVPLVNTDAINIRTLTEEEIRKRLVGLINVPYVETCKYCNEFNNANLKIVVSGEQCSREYAVQKLNNMIKANDAKGGNKHA